MKAKEIGLAIAIIILTIFVTFYGINTLFPSVSYEDYCGDMRVAKVIENKSECDNLGGNWVIYDCFKEPCLEGYCDFYSKCEVEFDSARESRSQKVFFIALPLAIIIILGGAFVFGLEYVGVGLIGGGVGTLIYGSGALWPYAGNFVKFVLSLIALIALIWFAYWINKKSKKKK